MLDSTVQIIYYSEINQYIQHTLNEAKDALLTKLDKERECATYDGIENISKRDPLNAEIRALREKTPWAEEYCINHWLILTP